MGQNNQKWDKILEVIFNNPSKSFTVREISKLAKIPSSTAQRYLKELKKEGLIEENKPSISSYYKFRKAFFIIDRLYKTGFVDNIVKEMNPGIIILFGSVRKGEYESDSDIDIFIETSLKKKPNIKGYEKKIGHGIQLFIENDINKLQKNLYNNVVNGIKLYGSFSVK